MINATQMNVMCLLLLVSLAGCDDDSSAVIQTRQVIQTPPSPAAALSKEEQLVAVLWPILEADVKKVKSPFNTQGSVSKVMNLETSNLSFKKDKDLLTAEPFSKVGEMTADVELFISDKLIVSSGTTNMHDLIKENANYLLTIFFNDNYSITKNKITGQTKRPIFFLKEKKECRIYMTPVAGSPVFTSVCWQNNSRWVSNGSLVSYESLIKSFSKKEMDKIIKIFSDTYQN